MQGEVLASMSPYSSLGCGGAVPPPMSLEAAVLEMETLPLSSDSSFIGGFGRP
jgi:hypothetical protein